MDSLTRRSALRWLGEGFSERSGIKVELVIGDGLERLPRDTATALFRVAQESLSNVHRHSRSSWARIVIGRIDNALHLEIADGGCGFPSRPGCDPIRDSQGVGVGVSGMRIRLEQLRGTLDIVSGPSGTRVTATVPLEP